MKLIHLSDLHFGTELPGICDELKDSINELAPDIVVVSGDFTQIASSAEFRTAQEFLKSFPAPVFCVPGNHDIPRFHLMERFFKPYKKYRTFINEDLCPVFEAGDTIIAGLNSARRMLPHWNWANGAISMAQLEHLRKVYEASTAARRVCVFHHPVHESLNVPMDTVVFGAKPALRILNELKVDLVLTGHVHHASITTIGDIDNKTIYLSASTALSSRLRKQENGFNVVCIDKNQIEVEIFIRRHNTFASSEKYHQAFK